MPGGLAAAIQSEKREGGLLKITVNTEPNCKRILEIEIPQENVAAEFEKQVMTYRSEATIPGFRRGKAPKDVVKKRFYDSIKADVLDSLVPKAYDEAIDKEKLNPIAQPKIANVDFDENKSLKFRAELEIRPQFDPHGYKGLKFKKETRKVTDEEINEGLQRLQRKYAEYHPVERPCHDQDLVIVDLFKKYDKMGRIDSDKLENVEVNLGSESVLKEFKEGLKGMGIGEMKDIEVRYPDDYPDKQLAGNEVKYTALIKEVKEVKLPELNDDFAKNYAEMENFEALKKTVRETLEKQANQEADSILKSDMIGAIVKQNHFEVPESMIENYLKSIADDFKKRYKDVDELKLRQSYRPVGEDFIRWHFLYREIAKKENLVVAEQERADWVKQFASAYNMSEKSAREALGKAGKFEDIDDNLLERKVLDFVKENSEITQ